ncbi:MAG: PilC/PilY family type IV pilus protein [Granulosicoccus sp.]
MIIKTNNTPSSSARYLFKKALVITCGMTLSLALATAPATADDTEVFFGQVDPSLNIYPNVMFVLDTSGSMNWYDAGIAENRLERLKEAMSTILDSSSNVNIGLMRMNGYNGGGAVIYPVTPIDQVICDAGTCGEVNLLARLKGDKNDAVESLVDDEVTIDGAVLSMSRQSNGASDQLVGLRFTKLLVPQGATITSARLEFTAESDSSEPTSLQIRAEDINESKKFKDDDENISDRNTSSAVQSWTPGSWTENNKYQTDDISHVLQEVIDRNGWCGGNALSLVISGNGVRNAYAYESGANKAPALKVTYDASTIPSNGGCMKRSVVSQISNWSDDAQEWDAGNRWFDGYMYRNQPKLYMPRLLSGWQMNTGLRFTDLKIPKNAIITGADLQFEISNSYPGSGPMSMNIDIENSSNPTTYQSGYYDITNRQTAPVGPVIWNAPHRSNGAKVKTPQLKTLVQSIVNRADWDVDDNAMAFVISRNSGTGTQDYKTFEQEASAAVKLRINYKSFTGSATGNIPNTITARDELKEVVNNLTALGSTPIVSSYLEATQYYLGGPVHYGRTRGAASTYWGDQRSNYHRVSHSDSWTGGTLAQPGSCSDRDLDNYACKNESIIGSPVYKSPLANSCQTNHIIFLSDGEPTSNTAANAVRSLTGNSNCSSGSGVEECGVELATWLYETDHNPNLKNTQAITTYTIGFNLDSPFLESLATAGGGAYFQASSATELTEVFDDILADVLAVDTSFVAPGATVNQFNRLTHDSNIYFALFQPGKRPVWNGNIKRFKVAAVNDVVEIVDANNDIAVDKETGFFSATSQSFWSTTKDGHAVSAGGAAAHLSLDYELGTGSRRILTYTGDSSSLYGNNTQADLRTGENTLSELNNDISLDMLGIQLFGTNAAQRAAYRTDLLKWARGVDVRDEDQDNDFTESRFHMGDPMHSRPVILNYANGTGSDTSIFVSTNEGFLHSLDQETGKELYSFIPQELLANLHPYFQNKASLSRPYGLDGSISIWTNDINGNSVIDGAEKAYLYVGMRRGGSNYYALDVTDRYNPKLAWVIKGGSGGTTGFEQLGQTWSRPIPNRMMINGVERDVLVFAGGYSVNQDAQYTVDGDLIGRTADNVGRGLFVVDAFTGEKLWSVLGVSGGSQTAMSDMEYSIPGNIRVIDIDFDGLTDQMYVGDTGGQLWRFDVARYHTSGELMTGGVLADLSGSDISDQRRFYSEPDVAVIARDGDRFLSISIGSGWRAHPLDEIVDDRFYMVRSDHVYAAPEGYGKAPESSGGSWSPITESDLINITDSMNPGSNQYGWMLEMEKSGEKVLGSSITINNQVVFTAFRPAPEVAACTTAEGEGVVYAVNIIDGSPTIDLDKDGEVDSTDDRVTTLVHGGIPPDPTALITEHGAIMLVGAEQPLDIDFDNLTQRSFWVDVGGNGNSAPQELTEQNVED